MTYDFQRYDVLQIRRPGGQWTDYATIRTEAEALQCVDIVDQRAVPFGTDRSCAWRIRRVLEDRTVYRREEEL